MRSMLLLMCLAAFSANHAPEIVRPDAPLPLQEVPAKAWGIENAFPGAGEMVNKLVRDPAMAKGVLCNLQAAAWGFDMEISLSASETSDHATHRLVVSKGRLTDKVLKEDMAPNTRLEIKNNRYVFKSQDEAFVKGVPFFVTNVSLISPTELKYTVVSNPSTPKGRWAMVRIAESGEGANVSVIGDGFGATPEPLTRSKTFGEPLRAGKKTYLSIVFMDRESGYSQCPASNEVQLSP
jgi:hypothetical protein